MVVGVVWTGRSAPGRVGAALWLAVVVGVFVVLASCGAVGYWLMDRARLRTARDSEGAGGRPGAGPGGWSSRGGPASWSVWRAPTPTEPRRSSRRTRGRPARSLRWLQAAPYCSRPRRCLPCGARGNPRRAGRFPAVRPAAGRQGGGRAGRPGHRDRSRHRSGHRPAGDQGHRRGAGRGSGVQGGQPARLTGPAGGGAIEGGYLGGTTAATGLFLVVVAWVGGRLALAAPSASASWWPRSGWPSS